jgi:DNA-directed RNA polymerase specialized sigma24 family protein
MRLAEPASGSLYKPVMTSEAAAFHTTRWTLVRRAQQMCPEGQEALRDLCEAYYEPVVAFLCCELRDADAAREMSHSFFTFILEGGRIHAADESRGRFRSYLLGAVKHYLARERESMSRLKRGAAQRTVSLDDPTVAELPGGDLPPDAVFERQWALTVLARSMETLRSQCEAEGRQMFFDHAQPLLNGEGEHGTQELSAAACGLSLPAFRMAVSRLRHRLRQCLKDELAGTLASADMVQEEMDSLFAALGR